MALLGARVAPRDAEHLVALADEVLDQAAAGCQVDDVVLVDRRRDDQQRRRVDLRRGRLVLDQLEHVGVQDDRALADREVAADLEPAGVDHRGQPAADGVARELRAAGDEVRAAAVDRLLEGLRVREWEVRRRGRVQQVLEHEAGAQVGPPVELGVLDEPPGGPAHGEVRLHQPVEHPAVLPRAVAEAAVTLGRRQLRAPGRDARQLGAEAAGAPRHTRGMASEPGSQPRRGRRLHQPADGARLDGRVGQHHLERRARGGAGARGRPAVGLGDGAHDVAPPPARRSRA